LSLPAFFSLYRAGRPTVEPKPAVAAPDIAFPLSPRGRVGRPDTGANGA